MLIKKLQTQLVNIPLEKTIKTAIHDIRSVACVLVSIHNEAGLVGEGYCFALNAVRIRAFDEIIKSFAPLVEGRDADYIEGIWENIYQSLNAMGQKGMTIGALAAVDTALWDLHGKTLNKPLHRIFGACRDRIKTYASGGLWLSQSIDELCAEAQHFVDQGFKSMKVRVGKATWQEDIQRVKALRETLGDEIELLADANQSLDSKQAIRLGRELAAYRIDWFEEPVSAQNLTAHAEIRQKLDINIASGETEYTRYGMKAMLDARACDILMPDLQRIGGISEMKKVTALCASYNVPISTHIFTEYSLCIAGATSNCLSVEHMPWFELLFNERMEMTEGDLLIPERAGTGFTFNQNAIARFKI